MLSSHDYFHFGGSQGLNLGCHSAPWWGRQSSFPHSQIHTGSGAAAALSETLGQEHVISEPTKENTVGGGRADRPPGKDIGGQAGAASKPVRHQVKYSLKTFISISYINTPGPDRKPAWGK